MPSWLSLWSHHCNVVAGNRGKVGNLCATVPELLSFVRAHTSLCQVLPVLKTKRLLNIFKADLRFYPDSILGVYLYRMQRCANTLMLTSAWESFVEAWEKFGGHVELQAHLCVWLCCFAMVGHKDDGQRTHEMLHSRHFFICTSSCHHVKSKNRYGDCVTRYGDCMTRYGLRE